MASVTLNDTKSTVMAMALADKYPHSQASTLLLSLAVRFTRLHYVTHGVGRPGNETSGHGIVSCCI